MCTSIHALYAGAHAKRGLWKQTSAPPQHSPISMYRKDTFRSNMTNWILLLSEPQAKFVHRNKAIHSLSPGVPYSPKAAQNLARLHFTLHTLDRSIISYACKVQKDTTYENVHLLLSVSRCSLCVLRLTSLL